MKTSMGEGVLVSIGGEAKEEGLVSVEQMVWG